MLKYVCFLLFFTAVCFGQIKEQTNIDSISQLKFTEITKIISTVTNDTLLSKRYIQIYIDKAIEEDKLFQKAHGLTLLSYYEKDAQLKLNLLDSAIALTKQSDSDFFPMLPYFYKGNYYLSKEKYDSALDSYLQALKYARIQKNVSYEYAAKHNVAIIKGEIGMEMEALDIFQEILQFEKNRKNFNEYAYSETLHYLAKYSIRNEMLDSAKIYIEDGLKRVELKYPNLFYKLSLDESNYYFKMGDYRTSKKLINKVLGSLDLNNIENNRTNLLAHFYLGRLEEESGDLEKAVKEYLTVDSLSNSTGLKPVEIRRGYVFLINSLDEENKKYEMVRKTLRFDSVITQNGIQVTNKIFEEFDTPELLKEKEVLIKKLKRDKNDGKSLIYIIIGLLFLIGTALFYQVNKRIKLKRKFESLLQKINTPAGILIDGESKKGIIRSEKISDEIIEQTLKGLKDFELKNEFLDSKITSKKLADKLNTNVKYLSIIINDYKSKSLSNYLKDLRINYALKELRENKKLRTQYSIEGIAKEVGFNTSESFSSAFKVKTGMNPSYFIKELIKTDKKGLNS